MEVGWGASRGWDGGKHPSPGIPPILPYQRPQAHTDILPHTPLVQMYSKL